MKRFLLTASILLMAVPVGATTKAQLLDMHRAGLSPALILQALEKDPADFAVTPETLIELRKAGIPDDVLKVLLAPARADAVVQARTLYDTGKHREAASALEAHLATSPSDFNAGLLLAASLIKAGALDEAQARLDALTAHAASDAQRTVATRMRAVLDKARDVTASRQKLLAALRDYRKDEALQLADAAAYAPLQASILRAYIHGYAGEFDKAAEVISAQDDPRVASLKGTLDAQQQSSKKVMDRLDEYFYGGAAGSDYPPGSNEELDQFQFEEYLSLIAKSRELTPLAPRVLDVSFHAAILFEPIEDVKKFADEVLATGASLRLPMVAEDHYLNLVIDGKSREIYTERDPKPFLALYTHKFMYSFDRNKPKNGGLRHHKPFRFAWQQIPAFKQSRKADADMDGTWYFAGASTLDFGAAGHVPTISMLPGVIARYGIVPADTAVRKVGEYIVHLSGNPKLEASLLKVGKGSGQGLTMLAAALSAGAGNMEMATMAMDVAMTTERNVKIAARRGAEEWRQLAMSTMLNPDEDWGFTEIDRLLAEAGA